MITEIIVLTVNNEHECFDMYFTDTEKAIGFINNNFKEDNVKRLFDDYYEGIKNTYVINRCSINQSTM